MKILALHSDFVTFEAKKKAIKDAEEIKQAKEEIKECLVVFNCVEKRDESNPEAVAKRFVKEIKDVLKQVQADKVVLYPYVHLSSNPSNPGTAMKVLKLAEEALKKDKIQVFRSPFGWYKAFTISCKGHPLSELSREFGPEDAKEEEGEEKDVSQALKAEKKLKSTWYVLDETGKLTEIEKSGEKLAGFDFSKYKNLEKFAKYETAKVRAVKKEPPHVDFMKKLELVDYEPGSDPGNLRYYPKGRLIKALLERWVTDNVIEYGGLEVETPIMYDYEHPALKNYLNRFPARQYKVETPNKNAFLRFSACFGQFLMLHDATISYRDLPLRIYELTRYSFRAEQHGELTGLRRLRAFTMPDCHALCSDFDQAKKEMLTRFELSQKILKGSGLELPNDLEFSIRITKEFWESNKDFVVGLVKKWGKPALIEMWEERFFYFVMKYEWNFVDNLDKASALTTDQFDIENAERYDIKYDDKDGKRKRPLILHLSPSGAIERVIYSLLEKAAYDQKAGKVATLPLWLCPTQVRLIPVSAANHLDYAKGIADELQKAKIRVDVDDREESVNKRIRSAEKEWVPYILVIGDKEVGSNRFMTRIRKTGEQKEIAKDDLIKEIQTITNGMPFQLNPLPRELSRRPSFT